MFASRFSEADVERAVAAFQSGVRPAELCRDLGVSERTLYRWRRRLDGSAPVAPAQGAPTRTRLFAVVGDVFLLCTPIPGPMPLAQARMDWNDEPVPEPIVFSIVGDPEQGWHLIALAREPADADGDHAPRIEVRSAADEIVCRIDGVGREPLVPGDVDTAVRSHGMRLVAHSRTP